MANKVAIGFVLSFIGDGISRTLVVDAATGAFAMREPATQTEIASSFSLAATVPTGIVNVAGGAGDFTTTASILLGVVTFSFSAAPVLGTLYTLSGNFTF